MLPAVLHVLALIICLNVQSLSSPLAATWLFFHISNCAMLLYRGGYPHDKGTLWGFCITWTVLLGVNAFILNPVSGACVTMWMLMAMPSIAVCLHKDDLPRYIRATGGVIVFYAVGLIVQHQLHVLYTSYNTGNQYAWPLLDPNCAAAMVNLVLVPSVWLLLNRDLRWGLLSGVLLWAMYATGSKAGFLSFGVATFILLSVRYGAETFFFMGGVVAVVVLSAILGNADFTQQVASSIQGRLPIWESSWEMLQLHPYRGVGLGMFGYYYQRLRTEIATMGFYAHNDLLQLAIETGVPSALVFLGLLVSVAATTCKDNLVSAVTILAVTLQAMVEFQFYVPSVSLALGVAVAYHILNRRSPAPAERVAQPSWLNKVGQGRHYDAVGNNSRPPSGSPSLH